MGCKAQSAAIAAAMASICNAADRPKRGCATREDLFSIALSSVTLREQPWVEFERILLDVKSDCRVLRVPWIDHKVALGGLEVRRHPQSQRTPRACPIRADRLRRAHVRAPVGRQQR